ncbi:lysophospholipid acyltransferase family protein [Desulfohalobiaceae bacterium Ax17]|uniref:lysophospholipid acyltransferase family protein n=1 Tax=Desulfovulcanus ferrireducens TaxID=2831190 RepID=UPI00207B99D5|nr:lysophospholipid acyltransferase family protein [Desulfovulcanus ferrireducens]MBT8763152.1 lysophospholipid acyltransferase family protein [Desulfovulcanus ferrireducens]
MQELLYNLLFLSGQHLSFQGCARFGRAIGRLLWLMLPGRKDYAVQTIAERLDLDRLQAKKLALSSFEQTGQSFLEIFLTRKVDFRFWQENLIIHDQESLSLIRNTKRPVVAVSAHLGAWELMAGLMKLFMHPRPSQIVVRLPKDRALGNLIKHQRSQSGVEIIEHRRAAPRVLRCLKRGGASAFLVDHNCLQNEAIFIPFLNKKAAVNMGPALLALRGKALVWPAFLVRLPGHKYKFYSFSPLDTRELEGSRQEQIAQIARFYTQKVEQMVKKYPEQWFWMHKRWKTRPKPLDITD